MEEQFKAYEVSETPFKMIYVNLTSRCNMHCNFCYMEGREDDDMSLDYFEEVCKQLPHRVVFRMAGGEPTIHPKFFDFLRISKKYGHLPTIVSNGKKFLDKEFIKDIKNFGSGGVWCITLNGGWTNPDAYKLIDNEDCIEWKNKAISNLLEANIKRVALSAIIVKGLNEHVIGEFVDHASKYRKNIRYLKFRASGNIGRHVKTLPYTMDEFLNKLFLMYFDVEKSNTVYTSHIPELLEICKSRMCCHHFTYDKLLLVSFVEFATLGAALCWKRGKLDENFKTKSFFGEMSEYAKNKEISI